MTNGEGSFGGRWGRLAAAALCALLVAGLAASPASAAKGKKKKKKKPASVTKVLAAPASPGSNAAAAATCTGKTHATGGGFSVAPNLTPPATGVRTLHGGSNPVGVKGWVSTSGVYSQPATSGTYTGYAVCEGNKFGKIAIRGTSTLTLPPAAGQNMVFNCPAGTHVISGGFSATALGSFVTALTSHRIVVLQSRRTGAGQWTISAYNNPNSPAAASLSGFAVCELNAKKVAVTEASAFAPLVENQRTTAAATCPAKTHVVAGGFLVTPATFPGAVPLVGIDENQPVGKRTWHVGLWEYPTALPPGSQLLTSAYCKKGK